MKLVKYEVRGTIVDLHADGEADIHRTFGAYVAVDPEDALRAAIAGARRAETIGQRVEDLHTVNVRIVKITEEVITP